MNSERFYRRGTSSMLVVMLHGYSKSPDSLEHVARVVADVHPDADVLLPAMPMSSLSLATPESVADAVLKRIDHAAKDREHRKDGVRYERLVLIGHSCGALLARAVYVRACSGDSGAQDAARTPREWASLVERIVLLAGMNRGWTVSHHLAPLRALGWTVGLFGAWLLRLFSGRVPLIMSLRRGRPFITTLRIEWLEMRRLAAARGAGGAITIQLLGTIDDMVSPEDNIDLVAGRDFLYFDVPASGHANVVQMDDTTAGKARAKELVRALKDSPESLQAAQLMPNDDGPESTDESVTDVVFVVHGIRDQGHWTHRIARKVKALGARSERNFATETSTYGYFPMLPFLLPWARWAKVEWLMDQYAEAKARYPNAAFSFVGHSNGTYLLAKALEVYPCCRFKHVVFAGSVVRRDYRWDRYLKSEPRRVEAVLNHVATGDWVVAWFPKTLQTLGLQDLGSAGHDGFAIDSGIEQLRYVRGAHSAALDENNWDAIAHFVVHGTPQAPPESLQHNDQDPWVVVTGRLAPLVVALIAAALIAIGVLLIRLGLGEWQTVLVLLAYLWVVWKVLTRF